ncbi:metallophosphoesterase [Caldicellulosiruptoraceae bacterium PP1]
MKILVISDTHGFTSNAEKLIKKYKDKISMVVHLGDLVSDAKRLQGIFSDVKFEIVKGNNDFTKDYPNEKIIELNGKRILITHGHMYRVKYSYDYIVSHAKALKVDAVFFGHTHEQEEFYKDNCLFLNPGSLTYSRDGSSSYALADVTEYGVIAYLEKV